MVSSRFIIDIKPHRYGWACALPSGDDERVFILKPQAIQFARQQCTQPGAEICIRDRHGVVQQRLQVQAQREAIAA